MEVLPEVTAIHLCGVADEDTDALGEGATKVQSVTTSVDELLARPEVAALVVCTTQRPLPRHPARGGGGRQAGAVREARGAHRRRPAGRRGPGARAGPDDGHVLPEPLEPGDARCGTKICRSGALGRIMAVEARMVTSQVRYRNPGHWLFRKDTAGTGILSWLGCHYLDLLCYFLDDRVVEVAALVGQQNPEQIEVEDTACLGAAVLQRGARHPARGLSPDRECSRLLRRRLRHLHGLPRYGRLPAAAARNGRLHGTQPRARAGLARASRTASSNRRNRQPTAESAARSFCASSCRHRARARPARHRLMLPSTSSKSSKRPSSRPAPAGQCVSANDGCTPHPPAPSPRCGEGSPPETGGGEEQAGWTWQGK